MKQNQERSAVSLTVRKKDTNRRRAGQSEGISDSRHRETQRRRRSRVGWWGDGFSLVKRRGVIHTHRLQNTPTTLVNKTKRQRSGGYGIYLSRVACTLIESWVVVAGHVPEAAHHVIDMLA